ncbi:orotate phosphoribosyltransferase [Candidatus Peregrinibacteria bacterium]|jgi:orotate phosphoribosyltransferase|nr:orotate phosphoribosyltransferase [Candidatus Peregrinibacteria bacterium]MBT7736732.1 orotate phosphoribosyltransferase [Candidatus Peregrinibacteria bacterium]
MSLAKEISANLLKREAVKVKIDPPFSWVSGIKSPVYCDNRKMIAFPEERKAVVEGFKKIIEEKGLEFDVIGGTATAAIPWAAFLAYDLGVPMIYIRPEKKEHGAGKQIEGHLESGQKVLIVEDLISTGGSSVKAAEAVREEGGCTVDEILAIVTWEMPKAIDRFEEAKIELHTLTDYTNIIGLAAEQGLIPEDQLETVLEFKQDPPAWGEKHGF